MDKKEQLRRNIFMGCKESNLRFWQCPPYLFAILSFALILFVLFISSVFILSTAVSIGVILFLVVILSVFGFAILTNFNRISSDNILKAELISIASHQLKTPLSNTRLLLDEMRRKLLGKEMVFFHLWFMK